MTSIKNHGSWATMTTIVNEPNLLVNSVKRKPTREKVQKKGVTSKAVERARYTNPILTITMDVVVQQQSGLGSLGVGSAVSGGLANFNGLWREHNPSEGKIILDDVDDSAEAEGEDPLTSTLVFGHYPFITA